MRTNSIILYSLAFITGMLTTYFLMNRSVINTPGFNTPIIKTIPYQVGENKNHYLYDLVRFNNSQWTREDVSGFIDPVNPKDIQIEIFEDMFYVWDGSKLIDKLWYYETGRLSDIIDKREAMSLNYK